jgi:hypothetical protein
MACNLADSADIGPKCVSRVSNNTVSGLGTSSTTLPSAEMPKQGKQAPVLHGNPWSTRLKLLIFHLYWPQTQKKEKKKKKLSLTFYLLSAGIPDFAEVYSFIGSVFDPDTKGHVEKLQEMDPINFETVSWIELNWDGSFSNYTMRR